MSAPRSQSLRIGRVFAKFTEAVNVLARPRDDSKGGTCCLRTYRKKATRLNARHGDLCHGGVRFTDPPYEFVSVPAVCRSIDEMGCRMSQRPFQLRSKGRRHAWRRVDLRKHEMGRAAGLERIIKKPRELRKEPNFEASEEHSREGDSSNVRLYKLLA